MTTEAEIDEFLSHFGVKGMHWGVRKNRSGSVRDVSTETKVERKASRRALQTYIWEKTKDVPIFAPDMTPEEYNKLSTKGESFVRGTMLKRISLDPNEKLIGVTYVSRLAKDSAFYRAALPAIGPNVKTSGGGSKSYKTSTYEETLRTTKKLSLPSEKARVDAFIELMNTQSVHISKNKTITGRQYLERHGYKSMFKTLDDQRLGLKAYNEFVEQQGNRDLPINDAYFSKLREKGYNALLDENDLKYTKAPLILLEPDGTVIIKSVRKLSTDEINRTQRSLSGRG